MKTFEEWFDEAWRQGGIGEEHKSDIENAARFGWNAVRAAQQTEMSMRDYFAAAALSAMDIQNSVAQPAAGNMARSAYLIADEMLKERAA